MGYSPWGRKESDMTEQLHFTSLHFTPLHVKKSHMRENQPPLFHSWSLVFLTALGGLGHVKRKSWFLALLCWFGANHFFAKYTK